MPWSHDDLACLWCGLGCLACFIWAGWPKREKASAFLDLSKDYDF